MNFYKKGSRRSFLFRFALSSFGLLLYSMLPYCLELSSSSFIWSKLNLNIYEIKLLSNGSIFYKHFYDKNPQTEQFGFTLKKILSKYCLGNFVKYLMIYSKILLFKVFFGS
jgi:hypothetical protein